MTNYAAGHQAEEVAAKFIKKQKYKILAVNWRNRYCEIDIIAQKRKAVHFIEVKYRQTASQGTGFDYITGGKLEQMRFAADFWVSENNWTGDYTLGAIELTGPTFEVTNFLPTI